MQIKETLTYETVYNHMLDDYFSSVFLEQLLFFSLLMSDCLIYAMHYLSKYPKTVNDLRGILSKKWFSAEAIDDAIPQLEKSWYLDDSAYARAYLNSEVIRKGKPLLLIKQKLLIKGVEKHLLLEIIASLEEEMHEGQANKIVKEIVRLREKGKTDPEIVQILVRKWFSYELVKKNLLLDLDQDI